MTRRRHGFQKSLKDYIVPITWGVLILILLISFFSWWNDSGAVETENKIWLSLELDGVNTNGSIVYPGWDKKDLSTDSNLYKWEKVLIQNGSVTLKTQDETTFKLNKNWEFKYGEWWEYTLFSSDLWVMNKSKLDVNMRYAQVMIWEESIVSFSQNEVQSTIYLLKGFAEVSNLVGNSTVLASGEKLVIERQEASDKDVDLSGKKWFIDDYFKSSDWFIRNNGTAYLEKDEGTHESKTSTWQMNQPWIVGKSSYLVFDNLLDESNISTASLNISWLFTGEDIAKITLNGISANLNKEKNTFQFSNISVWKRENDLIFKIYDDANDLLEKFVFIVYYNQWVDNSVKDISTGAFSVKTFDVDGTQFTFTSPSSKNTYTTYESFVTIRWKVLASGVASVTINWYKLNSFNGSTWRYHADTKYDNLKNGTNVYEVRYFDINGKVLYTNYYTIIKKEENTEIKSTQKISWEVDITE